MKTARYDVLGIGNAIVDVIARTEDDFLISNNLAKGSMRLIDEPEAERLYEAMGPATIISGGSASNTVPALSLWAEQLHSSEKSAKTRSARFSHMISAPSA